MDLSSNDKKIASFCHENRSVCLHCLSSIMAEFSNSNLSAYINDVSRNGEFNSFIKKGVSLKAFPLAKARQLNHHTVPLLEDNTYNAETIHVDINDLHSNVKSTNNICRDIIDIGLRCRNNNIDMIFISSIAYSSNVNLASIEELSGLLFD